MYIVFNYFLNINNKKYTLLEAVNVMCLVSVIPNIQGLFLLAVSTLPVRKEAFTTPWSWEGKKSKIFVVHDIHMIGKEKSWNMNVMF